MNKLIIRNARESDLEELLALSAWLPAGMTSMPYDRGTWEHKLELVTASFNNAVSNDAESVYLLVAEEPNSGKIVGSAGIHAGVGLTNPFYNYKLSKHVKASEQLGIRVISNVLNLVNDFTGETELTSLFLLPDYRENYAGQFLSRSRFLFMSDFPERFGNFVFAEIRGWLDESEQSPFWQHLGQKFFNLPFAKADFISAVNGSQFISDLMPRFPVYLELLPKEAVDVIGVPHNDSAPAMRLLEKEGFSYKGTIDIFDAGPAMECERAQIKSIQEVQTRKLVAIEDDKVHVKAGSSDSPAMPLMLSNCSLPEYRLVLSYGRVRENGDLVISAEDAGHLSVDVGSKIQTLMIR